MNIVKKIHEPAPFSAYWPWSATSRSGGSWHRHPRPGSLGLQRLQVCHQIFQVLALHVFAHRSHSPTAFSDLLLDYVDRVFRVIGAIGELVRRPFEEVLEA